MWKRAPPPPVVGIDYGFFEVVYEDKMIKLNTLISFGGTNKSDYDNAENKIDFTQGNIKFQFYEGTNSFVNLEEIDLSESKFIESERRITLPELPEVIQPIDKINNVGDFSTTSSRDLKYMLKLPLADDEIEKLYKGDLQDGGVKTFTFSGRALDEKINTYIQSNADALIKKQILQMYPDATDIHVINQGKNTTIDNREKYTVAAQFTQDVGGWWIFKNVSSEVDGQKANRDEGFENFLRGNISDEFKDKINKTLGYKAMGHSGDEDIPGGFISLFDGERWFVYSTLSNFYNITHTIGKNNIDRKTILKLYIQKYYKIIDINDIIIDIFELSDSQLDGWINFTYAFHIKRYSWQGYKYTFKTNLPSKELINRQTIYDRPKWKQLIKSALNPSNGLVREIKLEEKYKIGTYELTEIAFSSLFGDKIWINFSNGDEIEVPLNQRDDETISTTRILFY